MSHVDDGTLHAYLDGELSPPEAQGVEAHVAQCTVCRARLDEERALIARASELLARAAPRERDLPPFRAGDLKQPTRLWWQVRLPLVWAATIALALGIGTYAGEHGVAMRREVPSDQPAAVAGRLAPQPVASARDSAATEERERLADSHVRAAKRAALRPTVDAVAEAKARQEELAQAPADTIRIRGGTALEFARESTPMVIDGQRMAAPAAAPEPARPEMVKLRGYAINRDPIGVDSARVLLGREPLVLPDVPIRAIYRGRMIGYSGVVIIDQALDSTTTIEVINGRPAPLQLEAVVVSGAAAARADSQSPGARALLNARAADSLEAASRPAPAAAAKKMEKPQAASDFFVDLRGPLSTDSLAALRRLLRPMRP